MKKVCAYELLLNMLCHHQNQNNFWKAEFFEWWVAITEMGKSNDFAICKWYYFGIGQQAIDIFDIWGCFWTFSWSVWKNLCYWRYIPIYYFCNIGNVYKLTKRQEEKMFDYKDQNINLCIFQYFVVEIILEKETGKYPQKNVFKSSSLELEHCCFSLF